MNGINRVCLTIMMLTYPYVVLADSEEQLGDILSIAIPATAYGATYYFKDKQGRKQYYKSFGTTTLANAGLKLSGIGKRPHNSKTDSFPSGHTAYAFQGATFLHKRYGKKYGIPAYLGATYVAYSRNKKHFNRDIIAGAALGIVSSWYYTTPRKNEGMTQLTATKDGMGIQYTKTW